MADNKITKTYIDNLDTLITTGNDILKSVKRHVRPRYSQDVMGNRHELPPTIAYSLDWTAYVSWCTSCLALAEQLVKADSAIHNRIQCFQVQRKFSERLVREGIGVLTGLRNSLSAGILSNLEQSIAAGVSCDYIAQAKQLLAEGTTGAFDHVPAAVLAGAVLEHHLRQMCLQQDPAISITNNNGSPATLDPLIARLKAAGVVNKVTAKQLQAWAGIRNSAAHGQFSEFTRNQVEQMIEGISVFLEDSQS